MSISAYDLKTLGQFFTDDTQLLNVSRAYNEVGFFRRAVDIRRSGVANMPFALLKGSEEVTNEQTIEQTELHKGLDVFSLIPAWATDLDLYGAAYGYLDTDNLGVDGKGWVRIHPARVTPIYYNGVVVEWQINTHSMNMTLPVERLLYIWLDNQTSDYGHGEPLARAALIAASIIAFSGVFQAGFFQKGAINPTIVSVEGYDKSPPSDKTRTLEAFKKLFSGLRKSSEVQVVDGKTTVNSLQQNLKDMALKELTDTQKETVSSTLGVPLSLIMSNAANYATATQDDFNFYDKAIAPFLKETMSAQLNERLFKPLGYSLSYQPSRLDAYQAIELQKSITLNGLYDRSIITKDEYRESMGMEPLEETEELVEEETEEPVEEETDDREEVEQELKRWRKMATQRHLEGKPQKALNFTTSIIPPLLCDKIRDALKTAKTADNVYTIFHDARYYA